MSKSTKQCGENVFRFCKGETNVTGKQPIRMSSLQQSNHMLNSVKDGRETAVWKQLSAPKLIHHYNSATTGSGFIS